MESSNLVDVPSDVSKREDVTYFQSKNKLIKELYEVAWTIEGFNMVPFVRDHPMFGPTLRLGKETDSVWQLLLSKQRGEHDKLPSLGFKVVKTEENTVWDVCRYDVIARSPDGKLSLEVVTNALAGGEEDLPYIFQKGSLEAVYRNEDGLEQPKEDSPVKDTQRQSKEDPEKDRIIRALFQQDVLVVICKIRYTYMNCNPDELPSVSSQEKLVAEDLKQLFRSQKYGDVLLRAGEKEFRSHKNILCSRAYGFDLALQDEVQVVKPLKKIDLEMSERTAEMMLLFMYTGELSENLDSTDYFNLYKASCKYGINHLSDLCNKMLTDMNKESNCNDCMTVEDKYLKLKNSEAKEGPSRMEDEAFLTSGMNSAGKVPLVSCSPRSESTKSPKKPSMELLPKSEISL